MQKKIIALAVAGLASTAAFAQTNVTIYGSVDAGYSYRWDAENRSVGNHTRSTIDTGNSAGNRLGFKGTEDLGNGLKAVFLLEQGFNFDQGTMGQGGAMFGRQAYVGLAGGFGTAVAGRLYTPHFSFVSSLDPFAAGTVGQYRNVYGAGDTGSVAANLIDSVRVDNAVAYISPNFGGFDVTVAYSNAAGSLGTAAAANTENASENAKNNTVYAVFAKYAAGPVVAGLNYHRIAVGSAVPTIKTSDTIDLGASFDAKVVKIAALYTNTVVDYVAAQSDVKLNNYMLGLTAPIGKAAIKASVIYSDGNKQAGGDATQYAVGFDYNLSKRTNFYTAYSLIDANSTRGTKGTILGVADASNGGTTASGSAFQQGVTAGIRHQF
ncbi:porin [Dechloromonas sp. TW-R-39-2]|uniref:porin n=1 Tax=Dechloromonas sp. TW-R-39-2 TaxID=2654218 RepID=UPI00193D4614|nr:porin [Dechloromonas sp. TW-R-39-2]QRM20645.1 porin [Dechloromonas sp. TW-R-39-2]